MNFYQRWQTTWCRLLVLLRTKPSSTKVERPHFWWALSPKYYETHPSPEGKFLRQKQSIVYLSRCTERKINFACDRMDLESQYLCRKWDGINTHEEVAQEVPTKRFKNRVRCMKIRNFLSRSSSGRFGKVECSARELPKEVEWHRSRRSG